MSVAPPLSDAGDVSAVVSSVPLVAVATEAVTTTASRVSYDMTGFVNASTLFENYVPPTVHADMQSQGEPSQVLDGICFCYHCFKILIISLSCIILWCVCVWVTLACSYVSLLL